MCMRERYPIWNYNLITLFVRIFAAFVLKTETGSLVFSIVTEKLENTLLDKFTLKLVGVRKR